MFFEVDQFLKGLYFAKLFSNKSCIFSSFIILFLYLLHINKLLATYLLYHYTSLEPSTAKVTKSYSRRLPALERFYGIINAHY